MVWSFPGRVISLPGRWLFYDLTIWCSSGADWHVIVWQGPVRPSQNSTVNAPSLWYRYSWCHCQTSPDSYGWCMMEKKRSMYSHESVGQCPNAPICLGKTVLPQFLIQTVFVKTLVNFILSNVLNFMESFAWKAKHNFDCNYLCSRAIGKPFLIVKYVLQT